jgi:hypothetical protein
MIAHKKEFGAGLGMMIGFAVILILIFLPLYSGQNGLNYLDSLYNSISKGSAYYIPAVKIEVEGFLGKQVNVKLATADETQAKQTALLFDKVGRDTHTVVTRTDLTVTGDLGKILASCLADADLMYHNDGEKIRGIYNFDERQVVYNWYNALKGMDKDLKRQKKFKEAKIVSLVIKKAVECSYNYYTIEPKKITDALGVVIFSLVFYVIYTLWYGFAVMFMFEGWGMKLEH